MAIGILSLVGCASTPDRFYMLSPDGRLPARSSNPLDDLVLGIGPVSLPDYIDRAELVFQSAPNRFEVPPDHRWAGDPEKTFASVLATNIGHRSDTASVFTFPWNPSLHPRYTIPVRVQQFHAISGGDAILEVSWQVLDGTTRAPLDRGAEIFTEALGEEGYDGVVAAQSRLIGQLADAISEMIRP
jgi:uncharacterized lipoprotein YmbA